MKKEDIILAVFKLVYGGDEEPTTEVERLENDGILGALDATSDLVRLNARHVADFALTKSCVLDLKEPEYSIDELIADCRELNSTLNKTLRALIHKKNALYEIVEELELEKLNADDASCCEAKKISLC